MWLCEFIFNQAKLSGGGPTECILLLCIHKALLVLEQNSSFVLSELVMTSYSSPRPRRKSVHIFTMFFCSMFLNPSRDLEIFPQTSQEWEMLLDRVPVSVSEWLFGSFVLILILYTVSLVIMCISPVSTVIFPKSETAMLSTTVQSSPVVKIFTHVDL